MCWRAVKQKSNQTKPSIEAGLQSHMSRLLTKPTKWHVRPAKTQISLGIRPVWSESLLSAWRKVGSSATRWAHSEDSDQTGRIWVFDGRTIILLVVMRRLISRNWERLLWINKRVSLVSLHLSTVVKVRAHIGQRPGMVYLPPPQGEFCRPWFSWSLMSCEFFATC